MNHQWIFEKSVCLWISRFPPQTLLIPLWYFSSILFEDKWFYWVSYFRIRSRKLLRMYYFLFCFTESQNLWTVSVGRNLWKSSSPTSMTQRVSQEEVDFECLQKGRIHNPSGKAFPVLCHPQYKEVLTLRWNFLFEFLAIATCPVTGHHWKEPGTILLAPTLEIFICINEIPSHPSLPTLNRPSSLITGEMLQTPNHLCGPYLTLSSNTLSFLKCGE